MNCPNCKANLSGNPVRCSYCGTSFGPSRPGVVLSGQRHTDPEAIWALVLGIAGLLIPLAGWMASIAAIAFGRRSIGRIEKGDGTILGRGAAVAGVVLGALGLVSGGVQILVFLV